MCVGKLSILAIFLSSVVSYHYSVADNRVYTLRSIYKFKLQSTDCNLLKVYLNSKGEPNGVSVKGHCCENKEHTDFKVLLYATNRGLESTFQWLNDTRYYLTVKTTTDKLSLEKGGSSTSDNHRFILKSTFTPGCNDCVSVQSRANNKYLSTNNNGQLSMTTNRKAYTALFALHRCDPLLLIMCGFLDMSCTV